MGKAALLFVAAAFIAAAVFMYGQQKTALHTDQRQSEYQHQLLAREAAEAGLGLAVSRATRDFDAWRAGYDEAVYEGGGFDVEVDGSAAGPIQITAVGNFGTAAHQEQATLARLAPVPSALIVDADTADVQFLGNNFLITGRDTRPGSARRTLREGNGMSDHADGIWTRSGQVRAAFSTAATGVRAERLRGRTGQSNVVQQDVEAMNRFPVRISRLIVEARSRADESFPEGLDAASRTFGAPDDPQIVYVNGPAVFYGAVRGYGLLVVDGDLIIGDDFVWEGLVVARSEEEEMDVVIAGDATIYGALILRRGIVTYGSDPDPESDPDPDPDPEEEPCDCPEPPAGPPSGSYPTVSAKKVTICHIPPGNPGNAHTITISRNALHTHLSHHGDYDGPCLPECSCSAAPPDSTPPDEGGGEEMRETPVASDGMLRFRMSHKASIYYSSEAIGKLAARLPAVRDAARIITFDRVGEDTRTARRANHSSQ